MTIIYHALMQTFDNVYYAAELISMSGEVVETFEYGLLEETTSAKPRWKKCIKEFVDDSSLRGILYVFASKSWIKRSFWAIVVLTAIGGFCTVTILNSLMLAKEPISTSIVMTREDELEFPAVTICSLSLLNTTTLRSAGGGNDIISDLSALFADVQDNSDLASCQRRANSLASMTGQNISWGELITVAGNDIAASLRKCIFVGKKCTSDEFKQLPTIGGLCYTFNGNSTPVTIRGTGVRQGLRLQLSPHHQFFSLERDFGFRVIIHNPGELPRPESEGIVVPLNSSVYIGMRQVNSTDETVFSTETQCIDIENTVADPDLSFEHYGYTSYSPSLCLEACFYKHVIDRCNCTERVLYKPVPERYYHKLRNCTAPDLCCEVDEFDKVEENCDCRPKCSMVERTLTVSSATNADGLVGVNVFYESLFVETRRTTDSYTPWNLISDIGGNTGLFLGFTLLSWVELLMLVIGLVKDGCFIMFGKNAVN